MNYSLDMERAIQSVKTCFEERLRANFDLTKVSAPLAIPDGTGINDDLNGFEKPVTFPVRTLENKEAVVVHSLAKWKRLRLKELNLRPGSGILTNMLALRPEEDYSPLHSVMVDQWDWEQCIRPEDRTIDFLKASVEKVYAALRETEEIVCRTHTGLAPVLPESIKFIHAQTLCELFPGLTAKQREARVTQAYGAVFIIGIGAPLESGLPHDGRAPDYDDWSSPGESGLPGLNGDLLVWHPVLNCAVEITSMGIRVDAEALNRQLEQTQNQHRKTLYFHRMLLDGQLPECIGGGIGQSRVCMFMLRKRHIAEVQLGVWSEERKAELIADGIQML